MEMEARQQNLQKQTSMSDPERMMLDMESKEDDAEEEITEDYRPATNGDGTTASPANAENDANNGDDKGSADYKSMHDFMHKYSDQQAEPPKPDSELCWFHSPHITHLIVKSTGLLYRLYFVAICSYAITMGAQSTTKGH